MCVQDQDLSRVKEKGDDTCFQRNDIKNTNVHLRVNPRIGSLDIFPLLLETSCGHSSLAEKDQSNGKKKWAALNQTAWYSLARLGRLITLLVLCKYLSLPPVGGAMPRIMATGHLWGKFKQDNGLRHLFLTPVFSQSAFKMLEAVFESMEDLWLLLAFVFAHARLFIFKSTVC